MPNQKKSLGKLRLASKTKPRSPQYTGRIRIQHDTLMILMQHLKERGSNEVVANLAGWHNNDKDGGYLTIEISPLYVKKQKDFRPFAMWGSGDDEADLENSDERYWSQETPDGPMGPAFE